MSIFDGIEDVPENYQRAHLVYRDREHFSLEALINQVSRENQPAQPALDWACSSYPREKKSLGYFSIPDEIFEMIAVHLDLKSLRNLSATNSRIHNLGISVKKYQVIQDQIPGVLSLLNRTLVLPYFSISQIYTALTKEECTACGHFGGFVFLLTMQRCCSQCAANDLQFSPITPTMATSKYGLSQTALITMPHLHGIPGKYGDLHGDVKDYKGKHVLLSRREAQSLGKTAEREKGWDKASVKHAYRRNMCLAPMPVFQPQTGFIDHGKQCFGCWRAWEKHDDSEDGCNFCTGLLPDGTEVDVDNIDADFLLEHENMVLCSCKYRHQRDRLYSQEGILNHISECPNAHAEMEGHARWLKETIETNELAKSVFTAAQEIYNFDFWTTVIFVEAQPEYCANKVDNFVRKTGRAIKGLYNYQQVVFKSWEENPDYEPDEACLNKWALNKGSPRK